MTNEEILKSIGFKTIPHYTVMNAVVYDLGRNRSLSAGSIGTPNEVLFICETDYDNPTKVTDLICLHNYDHDGFLTIEKVQAIINAITK